MIPDILTADGKYNFSDGIGKISPKIAHQVIAWLVLWFYLNRFNLLGNRLLLYRFLYIIHDNSYHVISA